MHRVRQGFGYFFVLGIPPPKRGDKSLATCFKLGQSSQYVITAQDVKRRIYLIQTVEQLLQFVALYGFAVDLIIQVDLWPSIWNRVIHAVDYRDDLKVDRQSMFIVELFSL